MKTNWIAAAAATLGMTLTVTVFAEESAFSLSDSKPEAAQVSYVTRTGISDERTGISDEETGISDERTGISDEGETVAVAIQDAANPAPTQASYADGCDSKLGLGFLNRGKGKGGCLGEPWTLFSNDNKRGIIIGGHTQVGYHGAGVNNVGTELFNTYSERVQLNQQWLYVAKVAQSDGKGADWGFRFDYVYGTDGPDLQAHGASEIDAWDNSWDHGLAYGHAMPQLYAEVDTGSMRIKGGQFFYHGQYEVAPATGNFFYSRSASMTLAEPTSLTGVIAEIPLSDHMQVYAGWAAGWDSSFAGNGGSVFLGGVKMQLNDNMHLTYATTNGDLGHDLTYRSNDFARTNPATFGNPEGWRNARPTEGYSHTVILRTQLTDRIHTVFHHALVSGADRTLDTNLPNGGNQNYIGNNALADQNAYDGTIATLCNYVFYSINDCTEIGLRAEWINNDRWIDEIHGTVVGINYHHTPNLVIRPELQFVNYHKNWKTADAQIPFRTFRDATVFSIDAVLSY